MGPVDDVVRVDKSVALAAGELTSTVASQQRPPDRRRDRAGSPPDAQRLAIALDQRDQRAVASQTARSLGRDPGAVGDRAAAAAPGHRRAGRVGRQRRGIHVHEHLVALAGRAVPGSGWRSSERGLRERREGLRVGGGGGHAVARGGIPRGEGRGRRFRGTARLDGGTRLRGTAPFVLQFLGIRNTPLVERVASRLERAKEERSVDRRELRVEAQAAVVVVPVPAHEAPALLLVGLGRRDPPRGPDHSLELGSGRVPRELQELGLALAIGDPGERPHLRVAQRPGGERLADQRQLGQRPGDPDMLPRGPGRERATPGDPLRRRATARHPPAGAPVELADQLQPPGGAGVDPRRQALDLPLDQLERQVGELDRSSGGRRLGHEHTFVEYAGRRTDAVAQ